MYTYHLILLQFKRYQLFIVFYLMTISTLSETFLLFGIMTNINISTF